MKTALVFACLLALGTPALADDTPTAEAPASQPAPAPEPPKLAEVDGWKLRALEAERQLFLERANAEGARRTKSLTDALADAAKGAGVELKDYVPDLDRGVWRKRNETK